MKKTARLRAIIAALLVVFSLQMLVYAEEQPLLISAPVEQPDAWALDAVQWSAIYGLAPQELYAKYKSKATREELCTVCVSVYERLTGDVIIPVEESPFSDTDSLAVLKAYKIGILTETEKFEPQKEATRMEMVTGVYNVIKAAQPEFDFSADVNLTFKDIDTIPQNSLDIVKYSVSKGILNGRSKEILDLQSTCTRQELLVFAKNAYEFAVYESGRDSKGAFWKVTDEDSTVYLLGSIHLADPTLYPLSKDILKAYEQSDYLVVEATFPTWKKHLNICCKGVCMRMKTLLTKTYLKTCIMRLWSSLHLMEFKRKYTTSLSLGMQRCWFKICSLQKTHIAGFLE